MKLREVLSDIKLLEREYDHQIEITSVELDSRLVKKGSMFVAINGAALDGHHFIAKAIEKGAIVILSERPVKDQDPAITYLTVESTRDVVGHLASNFFSQPSRSLNLIGITGTNGKSTVATLLYQLLRSLGYKTGLLSTVENIINDKRFDSSLTTPDAITLNSMLASCVEEGCDYVVMEVSSHAIDQGRIGGLVYKMGLFTNLTHDHISYHGSFKNYRDTKKKFFDSLESDSIALSNKDDKNGAYMLQNTSAKELYYSFRSVADYKGRVLSKDINGLELEFNGRAFGSRLIGMFNAYNLLAVFGAMKALNFNEDEVLAALSGSKPPAGRFEFISINGRKGVVDYAHTPDALSNVIETILEVKPSGFKLITMVGCGGDRDKAKRPVMADVAATGSDILILTSDNPRSEDPEIIIDEMEAGIGDRGTTTVLRNTNRKAAIKTAVMMSAVGDIILLAGKGHEKYQEIGGKKKPFDDKKILMQTLNDLVNT